jgi:hypothetical protein
MRIARGMFRLWLVLSCLWIATVATIGYSSWPSSTVQQAATSKDSKTSADDVLPPCKDNDPNPFADFCRKDPKDNADDSKTYVPEYMKDASKDDPNWWDSTPELGPSAISVPAQRGNAQQSAQQLAVSTAELALIPPALILIVGIGLTWAFRGFST